MLTVLFVLVFVPFAVNCGCPTIISRSQWNADSPKATNRLRTNPPPFIVIHHTETPACTTMAKCKTRVKNIQSYHMKTQRWDDIGYNFLIGGDGNVYEGRGWGIAGSHVPRYNFNSIGIAVIGSFDSLKPPSKQLEVLKDLISCAEQNNYVLIDYKLIGHRQGKQTKCPGDALFTEISSWPHFDASIRP